jgi:predicted deacetylase
MNRGNKKMIEYNPLVNEREENSTGPDLRSRECFAELLPLLEKYGDEIVIEAVMHHVQAKIDDYRCYPESMEAQQWLKGLVKMHEHLYEAISVWLYN